MKTIFIFAGLLVAASLFLPPVDGNADMPASPPPSAPLLAPASSAPIIVADRESREVRRAKRRERRARRQRARERRRERKERQRRNG